MQIKKLIKKLRLYDNSSYINKVVLIDTNTNVGIINLFYVF